MFFPRTLPEGSLIKYDLLQLFNVSSFCIFIKVHVFCILTGLEEVFHQIGTKHDMKKSGKIVLTLN